MKLYDFEGIFNVEISLVQFQQLVVSEFSFFPTVCFIPSYLNQHSICFRTLFEFDINLKMTSWITLNIAWPMTIYFLHLYTIDINKYTYSRDTYHMLFHMIDSVNLRSFKIIIMFKWDKSLVPNEISITRGICIHNLNMIKYRSYTLDHISSGRLDIPGHQDSIVGHHGNSEQMVLYHSSRWLHHRLEHLEVLEIAHSISQFW